MIDWKRIATEPMPTNVSGHLLVWTEFGDAETIFWDPESSEQAYAGPEWTHWAFIDPPSVAA